MHAWVCTNLPSSLLGMQTQCCPHIIAQKLVPEALHRRLSLPPDSRLGAWRERARSASARAASVGLGALWGGADEGLFALLYGAPPLTAKVVDVSVQTVQSSRQAHFHVRQNQDWSLPKCRCRMQSSTVHTGYNGAASQP